MAAASTSATALRATRLPIELFLLFRGLRVLRLYRMYRRRCTACAVVCLRGGVSGLRFRLRSLYWLAVFMPLLPTLG